jgi:hypothetical protein
MGMGEKGVVVEHIKKGLIVDSKRQMCRWVQNVMAKCYSENVMAKCQLQY